jgi:hypothetical protein
LALSNMVGEDTFYEGKSARDKRFRDLVQKVTKSDPSWVARFVPYLRSEMNMRSASIVMAVEYVVAGGPNGRRVIFDALQRPDEPAEVIGYYRSQHGRSLPQPIKRGIADAIRRLYTERNAIKYDGENAGYRLADVIDLVHPDPRFTWQSELYRYLLDKRHNRDEVRLGESLTTIRAYGELMKVPVAERRALLDAPDFYQKLMDAGMTWESLSGWLQGPMDAKAWESIIPNMGYMALLRNLRNFEQAKISAEAKAKVIAKLTDAEEVRKSKQFPIRFYSAYKNVEGFGYLEALETALDLTLQNVPSHTGKTLVLVDNSGSMGGTFSNRGTVTQREIAGLFGAAVALRAEKADLYAYDDTAYPVKFSRSEPVLKVAKNATTHSGGTNTMGVLADTFKDHDRVLILTDEQTWHSSRYSYGYDRAREQTAEQKVKEIKVPIYTFNLAGYQQGHLQSGADNRYTFGGLTDAGFKMIELLERGENADWPF